MLGSCEEENIPAVDGTHIFMYFYFFARINVEIMGQQKYVVLQREGIFRLSISA